MSHNSLIADIEDWLVGKALSDANIAMMFESLCERLHALGMPLMRASLSWPTLHPLFRSEQVFWRHGEGSEFQQYIHETAQNQAWLTSPLYYVMINSLPHLRRQLVGDDAMLDFPVLEDFRDQGFTDYLVTATGFRIAEVGDFEGGKSGIIASWATKRRRGFSDADLDALRRIQKLLAVACRAAIQKRVMENLANAYLGPTAGWQVLAGDIRRGDGAHIPAVVWFSDLRGSTRLSDEMAADDYLALLNRYFECTAAPVIEQGGEILNFIGDGVLAIFPVGGEDAGDAVRRAVTAARAALERCAAAKREGTPAGAPLDFGIGLDIGKLMFGNIGVPSRLAFSGIGRVVNGVQRIEKATKEMGRPVLATAAVAEMLPEAWERAGRQCMADFGLELELFGLKAEAAEAKAAE